ncbi:MAG: ATP-binding cassette domain-containing protein [Bacteroidota bacterium]
MITVTDLTYAYPRQAPTLEGLNLHVPKQAIYGFLGANGAGKSTTIRALLGLLTPRAGRVELFGQPLSADRRSTLARTGSLIEAPALYGHLTAEDNLKVACTYRRIPHDRIGEVIDQVGLAQALRKPVRKYSVGMKQRLGLALALLPDPDLLILDEPTNGLDPNGIIEVRQLLRQLRDAGKTILLSSHLLGELAKTITHVGILHGGKLVFEDRIEVLTRRRAAVHSVELQTPHVTRAAELAEVRDFSPQSDRLVIPLSARSEVPELLRRLAAGGVDVYALRPLENDLESRFLQLTATQA